MRICVIGTGYVGLVSGTCFAETGNTVICVDIDENKVERLSRKECTIYEPGLEILLERNVDQGRLSFTTDLNDAVEKSDIIFLALPTPPGGDGAADLSYVLGMADTLGKIITDYKIIVDKSTVPVGTADLVHKAIAQNAKVEFDVVSNPEFLREGVAVDDFMKPDRVVIGTSSERARKIMERLYQPYVMSGNPIIFMDERSAEMTKYAANSFLATKISFMNEIANLCERTGANVDMIRKGMGSDDRIGKRFLFAGIGYGGSCFPKDVQALEKTAKDYTYDFKILNAVMAVNKLQKQLFFDKINSIYNSDLSGKRVALWGLAFKPNTDDIREAPALDLIQNLLDAGATVKVYDPEAMENVQAVFGGNLTYASSMYAATEDADFLVIATEWTMFRTPNFDALMTNLKDKTIFDGRNIYTKENLEELGFVYYSIGRP
jgi:UDPglucose 6-dehydrogenase